MRSQFDKQLQTLHIELIRMGSLCEQVISLCASMLLKKENLCAEISAAEEEIDQKERDIENLCMRLLLQQQPVARDLRVISAALKMISDMERIGDQAADIAELAPYLTDCNAPGKVHIGDMARATVNMVTKSIDAFVKSDVAMAKEVMAEDDVVDALFEQIKEELMELIRQNGLDARAAVDLLMAAKYFERIGDHAVNVAEWVEYSVTGVHKNDANFEPM